MAESVKAVVFDIGRVLVRWDLRCLFAKLIRDPAELEWFVTHVVTESWHFQHDAGRPLSEMIPERKAQFPAYAALIDAYAARFNETIPGPVPGTWELVGALFAKGVPLFALTNFGADFWAGFRPTMAGFDAFRDIVVSGVEKIAKPDPRIYALAEERFGFSGDEVLFIDDNAANIAAARDAGWQVHHFTDAPALEADLIARGMV